MEKAGVLVFGDFPQSLAVVRSLGRAGFRVVLASADRTTIAGRSRYCAETWQHIADPHQALDAFALELADFLQQQPDILYLYPVGVSLIERVQQAVVAVQLDLPVVAARAEVLSACHDKTVAATWAAAAGIASPTTTTASNYAELVEVVAALGYPLIIKTVHSEAPVHGRKAFIVHNQSQFEGSFPQWPDAHKQLLVQNYVAGPMQACDFVAQEGRVVAYYEGGAMRTDAPDGTGFVVEFCSQQPSAALFATLQKFVRTHKYSGPGLLQCVQCEQSGELYFVELNPRLSAGVAETVAAGLNIPLIALRVAMGEDMAAVQDTHVAQYRVGATSYWFERDILGWLKNRGNLQAGASLAWLRRMLVCLARCESHINWQWRDPVPSVVILGRAIKKVLRQNAVGDHANG